jgi:molybdate transport system substrate-binding protein
LRRAFLAGLLLACCLGCSRGSEQARLVVYCAAGMRPPMAELAEEFGRQQGLTVETDFAGSEMLLSRIKLTRRGDLFMPGDEHYVDRAKAEGLIASAKTACYFVPVILVQKGNPKNIRALADLTRPGLRLGLGDPNACAIGRVSAAVLAKNKLPPDKIDRNVVFRSLTVNELGNNVKLKELDAAIVWDAVAAYFAADADAIPIPPDRNVISAVTIGVLGCSEQPDLAEKFVAYVVSAEGREVLRRHRYTTELPKP